MLLHSSTKLSVLIIVSAFLFPTAAFANDCPTFASGQMVKVSGKSAIYSVNTHNELLYFPSGEEYKSWRADDTYGNYTTITEQCFDSLALPTRPPYGVNFRPGSYLVKQSTAEQLYSIQPGNTLRRITTSAAQALYGNTPVKTISPLFWSNYIISSAPEISDNTPHPGMFLSNEGIYFYVDPKNHLRTLSNSALEANTIKQSFFRSIDTSTIASLVRGDSISESTTTLTDVTQTNNSTTSTSPAATIQTLTAPIIKGSLLSRNGSLTTIIKPIFNFDLIAPANEEVAFRIQLDDSSDFSSPLVDFLSRNEKSGARRFVLGGTFYYTDTYFIGGKDQLLPNGAYYWRVKMVDKAGNESPFTIANNGNIAFITDTSLVPSIDVHYIVVSPDAADLTNAELRDAHESIQHHFISEHGEQLVRFNFKDAVLYNDFKASACGNIISDTKPLGTYSNCKDKSIIDPKAINLIVAGAITTSVTSLSKPYVVIKLDHLLDTSLSGFVQAHELGHALSLYHVCDPSGIKNIMKGNTTCSSSTEIPLTYYFGEKQSAAIRKRAASYVTAFSKL